MFLCDINHHIQSLFSLHRFCRFYLNNISISRTANQIDSLLQAEGYHYVTQPFISQRYFHSSHFTYPLRGGAAFRVFSFGLRGGGVSTRSSFGEVKVVKKLEILVCFLSAGLAMMRLARDFPIELLQYGSTLLVIG